MPTLAELRASRPVHRAERAFTICLAPHLPAEIQSLTQELETLTQQLDLLDHPASRDGEGEHDERPQKMAQVEDPRVTAIKGRMAEGKAHLLDLLAEMAEQEGELRVRAIEDGEWIRWANAHPARNKDADPAGWARDIEISPRPGWAYCNADDLIDDLAMWAYSWDGDVLGEGDWDTNIAPSTSRPDKKDIARGIVGMHEQVTDLGKWRADLSATLGRWLDAEPPERPESPQASTSDESPQSDTSTTTPPGT